MVIVWNRIDKKIEYQARKTFVFFRQRCKKLAHLQGEMLKLIKEPYEYGHTKDQIL